MKKNFEINRKTTNQELESIPEVYNLLKEGHVIISEIEDLDNPDFKKCHLIGMVKGVSSTPITDAQAKVLGFTTSSTRIERCFQNFSTEIADLLESGDSINLILEEDFALQINDNDVPYYPTQHCRQIRNSDGNLEDLVDAKTGKPVYRNIILVTKAELCHNPIKATAASKYSNNKVNIKSIVANA